VWVGHTNVAIAVELATLDPMVAANPIIIVDPDG
jgi:hypothetical protein